VARNRDKSSCWQSGVLINDGENQTLILQTGKMNHFAGDSGCFSPDFARLAKPSFYQTAI